MNNFVLILYTMPDHSRRNRHNRHSRRQLRGGADVPATGVTGYVTPNVAGLTSFSGGAGCSRVGGSALSDIAIPAVFIAANQFIGRKRSMGKSTKKRRGSRRVRFSRRRR